jgi:hypothetical protein
MNLKTKWIVCLEIDASNDSELADKKVFVAFECVNRDDADSILTDYLHRGYDVSEVWIEEENFIQRLRRYIWQ